MTGLNLHDRIWHTQGSRAYLWVQGRAGGGGAGGWNVREDDNTVSIFTIYLYLFLLDNSIIRKKERGQRA